MPIRSGFGLLRHAGFVFAGLLLVYGTVATASQERFLTATPEQAAHFETKVRPILAAKCYACHGEKEQIAGLRLDQPISTDRAKRAAEAVAYPGSTKRPPSGKLPPQ
ncbi:MAG TPA: hypothetical protein PKA27_11945, partial [Fimbriimonadaceae bacterium]|nr:hypothetical protein [Fimbriimonadaceae bacterium]